MVHTRNAVMFLCLATGTAAFTLPNKNTNIHSKTIETTALHAQGMLEPPQNPFEEISSLWQREVGNVWKPGPREVVIDPDYKLAWLFGMGAFAITMFYPDQMCFDATVTQICPPSFVASVSAFLHLWFAIFLVDRAQRIRCVFEDDAFVMKDIYSSENKVQDEMTLRKKNYVVGGANRWKYKHFVNYSFFPSVHIPILVYFKETQTPQGKWVVGPGKYDHRNNGMVHFFPAFGNAYQIRDEFERRNLSKIRKN